MKLNKILALSAAFACGLTLASCGEKPVEPTEKPTEQPTEKPTDAPVVEAKVSVGLGYAGNLEWKESKWFNGAQLDLSTAMVAFDKDGKIVDTRIDVVQVKVAKGKDGAWAINNAGEDGDVLTKLELGTKYNMQSSSAIEKEVDEQIEAFADWTVGQTVAELKGNINPEHGHGVPAHEDLASSCTIDVNDFVAAIEQAEALKTDAVYAADGIKAGVNMVSSFDAKKGEIIVDLGGAIVKDGKAVAARVDCVTVPTEEVDGKLQVKADGKYVQNGKFVSKFALKEDYGMVKFGGTNHETGEPCTLEWYEQANIISKGAEGLTSEEIAKLVKNEGVLAGATINLSTYVSAMATAAKYAELDVIAPRA